MKSGNSQKAKERLGATLPLPGGHRWFMQNLLTTPESTLLGVCTLPPVTGRALGKSLTLSSFIDEPKVLTYFQLAVTRCSKKHLIINVGLEYQVERYV